MQLANKENHYHYNSKLKNIAVKLRKNMPKAEACAWKYLLSRKQMMGYSFKRQRPVLNYVVDFMCTELMLIIEVDGLSHEDEEQLEKDKKREDDLKAIGFHFLRFSNWEVLNGIDDVAIIIGDWIRENRDGNAGSP